MEHLSSHLSQNLAYGPTWSLWAAIGGAVLFALLGVYAVLLLFQGHRLPARLRSLQPPTLHGRMITALILVATLPTVSLALVLAERASHERLERTATLLGGQAIGIAKSADFFLDKLSLRLVSLARHLSARVGGSDKQVVEFLQQYHRTYGTFETLLLVDSNGAVVATTTLVGDQPEPFPGMDGSLANLPYVRQPLEVGLPYVTDALDDPHLGKHATVAVGVPVRQADGSGWGVVIGSLALSRLSTIPGQLTMGQGVDAIILDRNQRVLFASASSGLRPFQQVSEGTPLANLSGNVQQRVFNLKLAARPHESGGQFLAASSVSDNGWQIVLYRSLDQLNVIMWGEYKVAIAWLIATLIICTCLALAMAKGITNPLKQLDRAVRQFDLELDQDLAAPPADAPQEVRAVFEHLGSLAGGLRASYQKLHKAVRQGEKLRGELIYVIANREKEIEKRTEELREANETLERISRVDSLTGVANRRWFAEFLDRTWRSCMRDQKPLSMLVIDIDDFKIYNDTYGHQKGDTCLKLVAESIRRVVGRASDLVSRYGGEEFVVVLGDTPLDGALQVAESIRSTIEGLGMPHQGSSNHGTVTVSIGVTSTVPARGSQPETLLVSADRAMYTAKHDGKNRVAYSTAAQTGVYQALCLPSDVESRPS